MTFKCVNPPDRQLDSIFSSGETMGKSYGIPGFCAASRDPKSLHPRSDAKGCSLAAPWVDMAGRGGLLGAWGYLVRDFRRQGSCGEMARDDRYRLSGPPPDLQKPDFITTFNGLSEEIL